jgi:4-amino-4-deoxy-L-arabinose transferase
MWQMALSMKVFGINELAMRLPSVLLGTGLILLVYAITQNITQNKSAALFAAAFQASSCYHILLISGIRGMDHNDIAHGFYILASIWALTEYHRNQKRSWILCIGVFAGLAILNKWLTGLFVFAIWGIYLLQDIKNINGWKDFMLALIVCCIVFLPWQIYILNTFPDLANYEYKVNNQHLTEAVHGHTGDIFYYFNATSDLIGTGGRFIFIIAILGIILLKKKNFKLHISLNIATIAALLFYSIIVPTKITTYVYFLIPLLWIEIAQTLHKVTFIKLRYALVFLLLFCIANPLYWKKYLSKTNHERNASIFNNQVFKDIKKYIPEDCKVVMNMNSHEDINLMFYHNDITAYHWTLSEAEFVELEKRKIKIAVFQEHTVYVIPDYVSKYPYLTMINIPLYSDQ